MTYYSNFWVYCLTHEQHSRTCGYWYTVRSDHMAHIAFRTRKALNAWLSLVNLTLPREISDAPDSVRVVGEYRQKMHMNRDDFDAIEGDRFIWLCNGSWSDAKRTVGPGAIVTIHYCNPNERRRPLYDDREARRRWDEGRLDVEGLKERERNPWEVAA